MAESLIKRLGGVQRISAIVEDSIDRHAVNPVLAERFRGKDLPRLKALLVQFFSGGPQPSEGAEPRAAHAGMKVSEQELLAVIDDVVAALHGHGVQSAEVDEVVGILHSLKGNLGN